MSGKDRLHKENTTSHKIEGSGREGSERSKLRPNELEEVSLRAEERTAAKAWDAGGQRRGRSVGSRSVAKGRSGRRFRWPEIETHSEGFCSSFVVFSELLSRLLSGHYFFFYNITFFRQKPIREN